MSKGMTQTIGILQVLAGCQLLWKWWYLMRYKKAMVEGRGMEYQQNELTEDIC